MQYGATNSPLRPLREEISILAGLGFDYLELCLDPPESSAGQILNRPTDILSALKDHDLKILTAHLPTFVWLADINDSIRQASISEVIKALDVCARLGVKKAVLHPGYLTGMLNFIPQTGKDLALESLESILVQAGDRGVTICLENMFPRAGHMYRPEEFTGVLEQYPDLMLTLDLGHANIKAPRERMFTFIEMHGRRVGHVHVSDNTGAGDEHLPVGVGRVDVRGGLAALKQAGYAGTITLEVFSPDREYLAISLRKVKEIWEES